MKLDVTDVHSRSHRHAEGLDGAIQVLVIKRIFIVPHAATQVGHFVTHEEDAVASRRRSRSWLDLIYRRTCPSRNRWVLSIGAAYGTKTKGLIDSGHGILFVRSVVILVALVWMTLAPGAFVGDDVFRFGKIGRPRV